MTDTTPPSFEATGLPPTATDPSGSPPAAAVEVPTSASALSRRRFVGVALAVPPLVATLANRPAMAQSPGGPACTPSAYGSITAPGGTSLDHSDQCVGGTSPRQLGQSIRREGRSVYDDYVFASLLGTNWGDGKKDWDRTVTFTDVLTGKVGDRYDFGKALCAAYLNIERGTITLPLGELRTMAGAFSHRGSPHRRGYFLRSTGQSWSLAEVKEFLDNTYRRG
ncbi:hypothetical protein CKO38_11025 [Rhodospirillum rubrum]|uniref:hypothetical protein n=1 Tax=Rhodospirillum rubrum TaxID=1085 RepID=UPI001902DA13|nr:hypothetical protein [Rhodospirillum rubrum]MBK1665719.1 hypothetical protein [Rhodospirillum rubrum]MBK1677187.1 hypothetical protein [Rhodospirillum rubrum]